MSNRYQEYNDELRREQLEMNRSHNRQVRAQKAQILAAVKRRSRDVKERCS